MLATELPGLQKGLLTTSLTGREWLACLGLAALLPLTIETSKWIRRRGAAGTPAVDAQRAVSPARAFAATRPKVRGAVQVPIHHHDHHTASKGASDESVFDKPCGLLR